MFGLVCAVGLFWFPHAVRNEVRTTSRNCIWKLHLDPCNCICGLKLFIEWSMSAPQPKAFVFTAPGIQPFRGLELMSTEQLVNDLDGLDNLLAHMLPALEMRDVTVDKISFECVSSPSTFLHDLQEFYDAYKATPYSEVKKTLYEAFKTIQLVKQAYTGPRRHLPNAGNYKASIWVESNGSRSMTQIQKHNAIKQTDLELSLPMLLEKVAMFTKQRLQIRKMQHTWEMETSQDTTDKMNALWNPKKAGNWVSNTEPTLITRKEHWGGGFKYYNYTQAEFNTIQLRAVEHRAILERDFQKYELEHTLVAEQDLRKRMLLLAQCSPTLQIALREGCCEPRIEASVEDVRVLWEKELAGRYASKCVHLAQQNTAPPPTAEAFVFTAPGTLREIVSQQNTVMKDLADQVARQSITLKEMQAKMDAQEQAQNENNEEKRGQIIRLGGAEGAAGQYGLTGAGAG